MFFKLDMQLFVSVILMLLLVVPFGSFVDGAKISSTPKHDLLTDDIGILLSKGCLTMLKNNLTTTCPGYDQILLLFPDQSNQKVSGKFVLKDGIVQRESSHYPNHAKFYQLDKPTKRIWIDPPADIIPYIKTVTIEIDLPVFKNSASYKMANNTQIVERSRYVSDGCQSAVIGSNQWMFLLGDTVQYLYGDCNTKSTHFVSVLEIYHKPMKHDVTTSYQYKYQQWLKSVLKECPTTFLKCGVVLP